MKYIIFILFALCGIAKASTIEFIVSGSPGGADDTVTRRVVEQIEKTSDLRISILNKPGASHTIAYKYVAESNKPILFISNSMIQTQDVHSQLDEIFLLGSFNISVYVSTSLNVNSINELIELSNIKEIKFGHGGELSYSYVGLRTICDRAKCLEVPYKSGANGLLDVMSNNIDAYCIPSYGTNQFNKNDKLRLIGTIRTEKTSVKLFSKNLSIGDKEIILNVLKSQNRKFYTDMGFTK